MDKPANERLVFQDGDTKLCLVDGHALLDYNGRSYHFGCQPYEPMAIIYCGDAEMAYIHNAFDVDVSCKLFLRGQLINTITGRNHDAEKFCRLLTTAIDNGFDWDIGELEMRAFQIKHRKNADVLFRDSDVELLSYGGKELMFIDDIEFFLNVDGKEYDLRQSDDLWGIYLAGQRGKSAIVARIHQVGKALLAAHLDDWKRGEVVHLGQQCYPYTIATLCQVLAFAVRSNKKDYNLREIEKQLQLFV